jgi:hypothetical protein
MRIHVIGHFDAAMAELIAHISHIMASHQSNRRIGVSQVMNYDSSQFDVFQNQYHAI